MDVSERKRRARREASSRRAAAHELLQGRAAGGLAERGLPFFKSPLQSVISGFFPFKSEISTLPLLISLLAGGWQLCMPVVVGDGLPLGFRSWAPGDAIVPGNWNIPVPADTATALLPDALLVPMLAFDRQGYRLGYGGGYYDRTLLALRALKPVIAIGVAYAAQEVAEVPREPFDQRLDYVMTEKETFACG